ncbi:MAG: DUF885 domain-containing protein [Chloroflexota bacterium]
MTDVTPAVGGTRTVPVPDAIARDYLLLALRLDQHVPGFVDGYFGPADLKAAVDLERVPPPARLARDADALRERLESEVEDDGRRRWLDAQLVAMRTQAASLAGETRPYVEHVTRCFEWTPRRRDEHVFDDALAGLDALLPGKGSVAERGAAWAEELRVPPERLPAVVDWLVARYRSTAERLFGLPAGEKLTVELVRNEPWSGYNWYDGGLRSRVQLNLDLPIEVTRLVATVAHETYPGHHLEHAIKEADAVLAQRRLESSVLLINTPECLISEGLAELGVDFAAPPAERVELQLELYERAGLAIAGDPAAARDAAERSAAMWPLRSALGAASLNAALMRHADNASHEEVLGYLRARSFDPSTAAKRLEFIEHPLWRTYVFVYDEGEALLREWLELVPDPERAARFARLLREPLTPGAVAAEIAAARSVGAVAGPVTPR